MQSRWLAGMFVAAGTLLGCGSGVESSVADTGAPDALSAMTQASVRDEVITPGTVRTRVWEATNYWGQIVMGMDVQIEEVARRFPEFDPKTSYAFALYPIWRSHEYGERRLGLFDTQETEKGGLARFRATNGAELKVDTESGRGVAFGLRIGPHTLWMQAPGQNTPIEKRLHSLPVDGNLD